MKQSLRVYDGAEFCGHCHHCPVVDLSVEEGRVIIHDPHKPESGRFSMSVEEYNALLKNAKPAA